MLLEVIQLILDGADERGEGDRRMRIMNPKRSSELLAQSRSATGGTAE
jgi:hypothetical protein